ncbi:hypothetical protein GGU11DRAFT_758357 [Lentinula aff. detonsa]|nr:hypothetical protein GGU11DRAFT_758357 [Lentinula aff. detonsa]
MSCYQISGFLFPSGSSIFAKSDVEEELPVIIKMEEGHSEGCRRSKSFRNAASSNGPGHDNDNTNELDDDEEGRPASQENIDLAHLNFVEQREGVIHCLTVRMTRQNLRHLKALAQQDDQDEDDDLIEVELYLRINTGVDMPYDSDNIKSKTADTDESVVSGLSSPSTKRLRSNPSVWTRNDPKFSTKASSHTESERKLGVRILPLLMVHVVHAVSHTYINAYHPDTRLELCLLRTFYSDMVQQMFILPPGLSFNLTPERNGQPSGIVTATTGYSALANDISQEFG